MSRKAGEILSAPVRSFVVAGRRTSVRLDPVLWDAMHDIAAREQRSLTIALHVFILQYYQYALVEAEQLALRRRHA
jgi:predicted DNA-binding ribbon-helix-helix protein